MEEIAEDGAPTDLEELGFDANISAQLTEGELEEIEAELQARGEP
ncbi:hypothetical protein [Thiohalorhabdus denitrificans]|nr:hypothetical protein [Thiohalorhabdus denitrificans]